MPQFCLTPDNYAETLRVCCSMDQIEKQVVLDSYTRTHLIQIKHLHLSKQPDLIKLKVSVAFIWAFSSRWASKTLYTQQHYLHRFRS